MAMLARVAVSAAAYTFDKPYDYAIPQNLLESVQPGIRVQVPFGRSNKSCEALVLSVYDGERTPELKIVEAVLDLQPVLDQAGMRLAFWLRERYFCTIYDGVKTILPAGLWYRVQEFYHVVGSITDEALAAHFAAQPKLKPVYEAILAAGGRADSEDLKDKFGSSCVSQLRAMEELGLVTSETSALRKVSDKMVKRVTLAVSPEEAMQAAEAKRKSAPLRYEVLKLLSTVGSALSSEICYFTGASATTLKSLQKAGLVTMEQEEHYRVPVISTPKKMEEITLNTEQDAAFRGISDLMRSGEAACALLYGVTGSGKTHVYLRLLQEVLKQGKTAMILVPEIALTPQMMEKFSGYFGSAIAMLHSGLKMTERYDQWKRIRKGEVQVVLGTRSAVFAPLRNLGLIILDEEQESSYQSEQPPRYHAREVAKYLCSEQKAVLVLGSATPTVETAYAAQNKRYHTFALHERYNEKPLPEVVIADLREELKAGNSGSISRVLQKALAENIEKGEQSILFLNRRGNSRMLLCGECGAVPECPHCSVPLTYHSANERLMCHHCGYSQRADEVCDECGGMMKPVGVGTQKVEEELKALFPGVPILRMDADTVTGGHEKLLTRFKRENIPIMIGTQMVAKGLDFENVTLVGVLAADLSLYVDHYQAAERTFSLLTQVIGRAGRGSKPGRAIIQTFTPDQEVILNAARQDYHGFYQSEIRMRRARRYPPFADLFTLTVSGPEEGSVLRAAAKLRDALKMGLSYPTASNMSVEIVGPAPAPILKLNNRYRYRVFWVGKNDHQTREMLAHYLRSFYGQKENRGLHLWINCNMPD